MADSAALVVGVDRYGSGLRQLSFAARSAKNVAKSIEDNLPDFGVNCLNDGDNVASGQYPTKRAVLDAIREMGRRTKAEDTFIFYFAGHGVRDSKGNPYLACSTSSEDDESLTKNGCSFDEMSELLRSIPARNILVVLDCCRDLGSGKEAFDGARSWKSLVETVQKSADSSGDHPNVLLWMSCERDQRAWESSELQSFVFAYYFSKAFSDDKLGRLESLSSDELWTYVSEKTVSDGTKTGHPQAPRRIEVEVAPIKFRRGSKDGFWTKINLIQKYMIEGSFSSLKGVKFNASSGVTRCTVEVPGFLDGLTQELNGKKSVFLIRAPFNSESEAEKAARILVQQVTRAAGWSEASTMTTKGGTSIVLASEGYKNMVVYFGRWSVPGTTTSQTLGYPRFMGYVVYMEIRSAK